MNYLNNKHMEIDELYSVTDYNKLVADKHTNQDLVKSTYEYGLLHVYYIEDSVQMKIFDEELQIAYTRFRQISKTTLIYMRIYSTFAEPHAKGNIIPKIEAIKFGITYKKISYEDVYFQKNIEDIRSMMQQKKAIQMLNIASKLRVMEGRIWIYTNNNNRIIYSPSNLKNTQIIKISKE